MANGTMIQNKTNEKAVAEGKKPMTLKGYVQQYIPEIEKALPSCGVTAQRFARLMTSSLSGNPKLMNCTPMSFIGAMMTAASLGLEPNTLGSCYVIPYGKDATFVLGYHGLLELVYRSGMVKTVEAHEVYEKDFFEYEYGTESKLVHKPLMNGDRGNVIAYYACYTTKDGGYGFAVMSKDDVENHRKKFSKTSSPDSPWNTNFDSMALKTVLKRCLKYAPLSTELQRNIQQDETVKTTFNVNDIADGGSILDVQGDAIEEVEGEVV